ncbi:MAG: RNase H family protein [Planctomycetota bacterium]
MKRTAPHYLLFTQANGPSRNHRAGGSWKFVLEEIGTDFRIEEGDVEPDTAGERLQLLAVIRGLEALEQPSHVTLVTPSRYVGRGIRSGLRLWKSNDWQWEHFGQKQTIKHVDFWKRIDAALQYHKISCRIWQFDVPHTRVQSPVAEDFSNRTPFVSAFADAGEADVSSSRSKQSTKQPSRPNRIRIDENLRERFFDMQRKPSDAVTEFLNDRVKPIGQGRAYGYAIN